MLIYRSRCLVAAHHIAGLLTSHRVSQERDSVREPGVLMVAAALKAELVTCDGVVQTAQVM